MRCAKEDMEIAHPVALGTRKPSGAPAGAANSPPKSSRVLPVPDVADAAGCELWSVLIGSIDPILSAANWSTVN